MDITPYPPQQQQYNSSVAALQGRAFILYCHGLRIENIAEQLDTNPAQIRQWIADTLNERDILAGSGPTGRSAEMMIAIEGYRSIAGAAWLGYEAERNEQYLAHTGRTSTNQGARYLALALTAQREVARLQGLYEKRGPEAPVVRINISERASGPENQPPETSDTTTITESPDSLDMTDISGISDISGIPSLLDMLPIAEPPDTPTTSTVTNDSHATEAANDTNAEVEKPTAIVIDNGTANAMQPVSSTQPEHRRHAPLTPLASPFASAVATSPPHWQRPTNITWR